MQIIYYPCILLQIIICILKCNTYIGIIQHVAYLFNKDDTTAASRQGLPPASVLLKSSLTITKRISQSPCHNQFKEKNRIKMS